MSKILGRVEEILRDDDWKFQREEDAPFVHLRISSENQQYRCVFLADDATNVLLLYTIIPVIVPKSSRLAICEYICRANHNMKLGNFEIDMEDGEVRFKASLDMDGIEVSTSLIRNLLSVSYHTCEDYTPGIVAVVRQFLEPADVIAMIERVH